MATYKCARELEGICLQEKDLIEFSDVGVFEVMHNSIGWYLNGQYETNDAVFKYLYGREKPYNCIKKLGDYTTIVGGVFPYLETAETLTEVVGKLFLEVERKRLKEFAFTRYVPKGSVAVLSRDNILKLCRNQVEQGNVFNPQIFEKGYYESRYNGGMDWDRSLEGDKYWAQLFNRIYYSDRTSKIQIDPMKEIIRTVPISLATLSIRRTQKPKLRTL